MGGAASAAGVGAGMGGGSGGGAASATGVLRGTGGGAIGAAGVAGGMGGGYGLGAAGAAGAAGGFGGPYAGGATSATGAAGGMGGGYGYGGASAAGAAGGMGLGYGGGASSAAGAAGGFGGGYGAAGGAGGMGGNYGFGSASAAGAAGGFGSGFGGGAAGAAGAAGGMRGGVAGAAGAAGGYGFGGGSAIGAAAGIAGGYGSGAASGHLKHFQQFAAGAAGGMGYGGGAMNAAGAAGGFGGGYGGGAAGAAGAAGGMGGGYGFGGASAAGAAGGFGGGFAGGATSAGTAGGMGGGFGGGAASAAGAAGGMGGGYGTGVAGAAGVAGGFGGGYGGDAAGATGAAGGFGGGTAGGAGAVGGMGGGYGGAAAGAAGVAGGFGGGYGSGIANAAGAAGGIRGGFGGGAASAAGVAGGMGLGYGGAAAGAAGVAGGFGGGYSAAGAAGGIRGGAAGAASLGHVDGGAATDAAGAAGGMRGGYASGAASAGGAAGGMGLGFGGGAVSAAGAAGRFGGGYGGGSAGGFGGYGRDVLGRRGFGGGYGGGAAGGFGGGAGGAAGGFGGGYGRGATGGAGAAGSFGGGYGGGATSASGVAGGFGGGYGGGASRTAVVAGGMGGYGGGTASGEGTGVAGGLGHSHGGSTAGATGAAGGFSGGAANAAGVAGGFGGGYYGNAAGAAGAARGFGVGYRVGAGSAAGVADEKGGKAASRKGYINGNGRGSAAASVADRSVFGGESAIHDRAEFRNAASDGTVYGPGRAVAVVPTGIGFGSGNVATAGVKYGDGRAASNVARNVGESAAAGRTRFGGDNAAGGGIGYKSRGATAAADGRAVDAAVVTVGEIGFKHGNAAAGGTGFKDGDRDTAAGAARYGVRSVAPVAALGSRNAQVVAAGRGGSVAATVTKYGSGSAAAAAAAEGGLVNKQANYSDYYRVTKANSKAHSHRNKYFKESDYGSEEASNNSPISRRKSYPESSYEEFDANKEIPQNWHGYMYPYKIDEGFYENGIGNVDNEQFDSYNQYYFFDDPIYSRPYATRKRTRRSRGSEIFKDESKKYGEIVEDTKDEIKMSPNESIISLYETIKHVVENRNNTHLLYTGKNESGRDGVENTEKNVYIVSDKSVFRNKYKDLLNGLHEATGKNNFNDEGNPNTNQGETQILYDDEQESFIDSNKKSRNLINASSPAEAWISKSKISRPVESELQINTSGDKSRNHLKSSILFKKPKDDKIHASHSDMNVVLNFPKSKPFEKVGGKDDTLSRLKANFIKNNIKLLANENKTKLNGIENTTGINPYSSVSDRKIDRIQAHFGRYTSTENVSGDNLQWSEEGLNNETIKVLNISKDESANFKDEEIRQKEYEMGITENREEANMNRSSKSVEHSKEYDFSDIKEQRSQYKVIDNLFETLNTQENKDKTNASLNVKDISVEEIKKNDAIRYLNLFSDAFNDGFNNKKGIFMRKLETNLNASENKSTKEQQQKRTEIIQNEGEKILFPFIYESNGEETKMGKVSSLEEKLVTKSDKKAKQYERKRSDFHVEESSRNDSAIKENSDVESLRIQMNTSEGKDQQFNESSEDYLNDFLNYQSNAQKNAFIQKPKNGSSIYNKYSTVNHNKTDARVIDKSRNNKNLDTELINSNMSLPNGSQMNKFSNESNQNIKNYFSDFYISNIEAFDGEDKKISSKIGLNINNNGTEKNSSNLKSNFLEGANSKRYDLSAEKFILDNFKIKNQVGKYVDAVINEEIEQHESVSEDVTIESKNEYQKFFAINQFGNGTSDLRNKMTVNVFSIRVKSPKNGTEVDKYRYSVALHKKKNDSNSYIDIVNNNASSDNIVLESGPVKTIKHLVIQSDNSKTMENVGNASKECEDNANIEKSHIHDLGVREYKYKNIHYENKAFSMLDGKIPKETSYSNGTETLEKHANVSNMRSRNGLIAEESGTFSERNRSSTGKYISVGKAVTRKTYTPGGQSIRDVKGPAYKSNENSNESAEIVRKSRSMEGYYDRNGGAPDPYLNWYNYWQRKYRNGEVSYDDAMAGYVRHLDNHRGRVNRYGHGANGYRGGGMLYGVDDNGYRAKSGLGLRGYSGYKSGGRQYDDGIYRSRINDNGYNNRMDEYNRMYSSFHQRPHGYEDFINYGSDTNRGRGAVSDNGENSYYRGSGPQYGQQKEYQHMASDNYTRKHAYRIGTSTYNNGANAYPDERKPYNKIPNTYPYEGKAYNYRGNKNPIEINSNNYRANDYPNARNAYNNRANEYPSERNAYYYNRVNEFPSEKNTYKSAVNAYHNGASEYNARNINYNKTVNDARTAYNNREPNHLGKAFANPISSNTYGKGANNSAVNPYHSGISEYKNTDNSNINRMDTYNNARTAYNIGKSNHNGMSYTNLSSSGTYSNGANLGGKGIYNSGAYQNGVSSTYVSPKAKNPDSRMTNKYYNVAGKDSNGNTKTNISPVETNAKIAAGNGFRNAVAGGIVSGNTYIGAYDTKPYVDRNNALVQPSVVRDTELQSNLAASDLNYYGQTYKRINDTIKGNGLVIADSSYEDQNQANAKSCRLQRKLIGYKEGAPRDFKPGAPWLTFREALKGMKHQQYAYPGSRRLLMFTEDEDLSNEMIYGFNEGENYPSPTRIELNAEPFSYNSYDHADIKNNLNIGNRGDTPYLSAPSPLSDQQKDVYPNVPDLKPMQTTHFLADAHNYQKMDYRADYSPNPHKSPQSDSRIIGYYIFEAGPNIPNLTYPTEDSLFPDFKPQYRIEEARFYPFADAQNYRKTNYYSDPLHLFKDPDNIPSLFNYADKNHYNPNGSPRSDPKLLGYYSLPSAQGKMNIHHEAGNLNKKEFHVTEKERPKRSYRADNPYNSYQQFNTHTFQHKSTLDKDHNPDPQSAIGTTGYINERDKVDHSDAQSNSPPIGYKNRQDSDYSLDPQSTFHATGFKNRQGNSFQSNAQFDPRYRKEQTIDFKSDRQSDTRTSEYRDGPARQNPLKTDKQPSIRQTPQDLEYQTHQNPQDLNFRMRIPDNPDYYYDYRNHKWQARQDPLDLNYRTETPHDPHLHYDYRNHKWQGAPHNPYYYYDYKNHKWQEGTPHNPYYYYDYRNGKWQARENPQDLHSQTKVPYNPSHYHAYKNHKLQAPRQSPLDLDYRSRAPHNPYYYYDYKNRKWQGDPYNPYFDYKNHKGQARQNFRDLDHRRGHNNLSYRQGGSAASAAAAGGGGIGHGGASAAAAGSGGGFACEQPPPPSSQSLPIPPKEPLPPYPPPPFPPVLPLRRISPKTPSPDVSPPAPGVVRLGGYTVERRITEQRIVGTPGAQISADLFSMPVLTATSAAVVPPAFFPYSQSPASVSGGWSNGGPGGWGSGGLGFGGGGTGWGGGGAAGAAAAGGGGAAGAAAAGGGGAAGAASAVGGGAAGAAAAGGAGWGGGGAAGAAAAGGGGSGWGGGGAAAAAAGGGGGAAGAAAAGGGGASGAAAAGGGGAAGAAAAGGGAAGAAAAGGGGAAGAAAAGGAGAAGAAAAGGGGGAAGAAAAGGGSGWGGGGAAGAAAAGGGGGAASAAAAGSGGAAGAAAAGGGGAAGAAAAGGGGAAGSGWGGGGAAGAAAAGGGGAAGAAAAGGEGSGWGGGGAAGAAAAGGGGAAGSAAAGGGGAGWGGGGAGWGSGGNV
ncbi:hypothetical protein HNY73_014181 [Argiope bruennichi]|uniref:Uncharacterized protein n=1 Tax=Argiope bruennichi TaxID=94029 RepID=A0A8T0ENC8_ARGBR|nr:hypothetical protein HNY73_014181 [Argiope bruennichi]